MTRLVGGAELVECRTLPVSNLHTKVHLLIRDTPTEGDCRCALSAQLFVCRDRNTLVFTEVQFVFVS